MAVLGEVCTHSLPVIRALLGGSEVHQGAGRIREVERDAVAQGDRIPEHPVVGEACLPVVLIHVD